MSEDHGLVRIKEQAHKIMDSKAPYSEEDVDNIIKVILSHAMNKIDFSLAEALCEKFIKSTNETLRMIVITSVGHIARVYRCKVNSKIMEEIERIHKDPTHPNWGTVDDVFDDMSQFLKKFPEKTKEIQAH